ncbi:DNA-processing protein DprA [Tabrizicola sp.]|uniref:DNA-processing protein DprA n=1 Tax=Tabrizicola sp. TaxID=2005166 RepID=UPI000BD6F629|nr:DNA-processing protein DprA [Tabrizicola sp.]MBY0350131.1 DNA-processing protein DprA [Tabrizicola sp.]OYX21392.1 MAG: DNA protecting protein DprA [Rhodobacterales bacterium 32-66-9]
MADGQIPNLQPVTEDDRLDCLRLARSRRVGAVTYHRLLAEHGSARAALAALPGIARAAGVEDYEICPLGVVIAEQKQGRAAGARLVVHGQAEYPTALTDLPDAPPVLWTLGDITLLNRPAVGMVGARNASSLGTRMARRLGQGLSEAGLTVVSGLARGIDSAAHEAALDGDGRTVAVMAGGIDVIYPAENDGLARLIDARGCRLSEHPPGLEPQARHFPLRNRIVAGLCRAVVVVEAAAKSGSLITARAALDYGREVMAVPGHPFDARASGCNMLIRDGALLVRGPQDVLEALGAPCQAQPDPEMRLAPAPVPAASQRPLKEVALLHSMILSRLGPSPLAEDQLMRDLNVTSAQLAPELVNLELEGHIARQPGGLLARIK